MGPPPPANGLTPRMAAIAAAMVFLGLGALWLFIPAASQRAIARGKMMQISNNARQLYLASAQMADDYDTVGDETFGWPGELAKRDGKAKVVSVKDYVERLIKLDCLTPKDAAALMRAPGVAPWDGASGTFSGARHCPFKIYRVTEKDHDHVLFAATRNFTYGKGVDPALPPAIDAAEHPFVLVHVSGDAAVYRGDRTIDYAEMGLLPGRKKWVDDETENPADTLVQQ